MNIKDFQTLVEVLGLRMNCWTQVLTQNMGYWPKMYAHFVEIEKQKMEQAQKLGQKN